MTKAEQLDLLEEIGGKSAGWYLDGASMLDLIGYVLVGFAIIVGLLILAKNYKLIVRKIAQFVLYIYWTVQAIVELSFELPQRVKENKREFFKNIE